tara:strand:- start:70 stop:642 length:573 start_codon:yes stop_codon:yes gene_type:complete
VIYFIDDFLDNDLFKKTIKDLNSNNYTKHKTPGKSFCVQEAKPEFIDYILQLLSEKEGCELESILGFFRLSTDTIDIEWRIHSDGIINDQLPDRAAVLYISQKKLTELHGTAFWNHKKYGKKQPENISNEEFDRLLTEDSGDLSKWELNTVLGYEQNRLLSYPANYFHGRYPNKSWEEGRQVFVMFYKIK